MQGEDTLRKLLGIYQSLYMDVNRELSRFPERLSPQSPDPLSELHRWLLLPRRELGTTPDTPKHTRNCSHSRSSTITPKSIRRPPVRPTRQGAGAPFFCRPLKMCGIRSARDWEVCKRLYGGGQSGVTLLFPAGMSSERLSMLKSVLDDFIPLGVPYTVVRREETVAMDGHS